MLPNTKPHGSVTLTVFLFGQLYSVILNSVILTSLNLIFGLFEYQTSPLFRSQLYSTQNPHQIYSITQQHSTKICHFRIPSLGNDLTHDEVENPVGQPHIRPRLRPETILEQNFWSRSDRQHQISRLSFRQGTCSSVCSQIEIIGRESGTDNNNWRLRMLVARFL